MSLPPTTETLFDDSARPYFLWWTDATVGQFKKHLASPDPEERAYWMGALLREANTRDVRLFVQPAEIRSLWPRLEAALRKDAGIDPGVLAWLLARFPTRPLPTMLEPLTADELEEFRDALAERLRNIAL